MLVGVLIWEIFSKKSSLKERARRASLLPRMLPLWPEDPGAPGVTPLSLLLLMVADPFSVPLPGVPPLEQLAALLVLLFVAIIQLPAGPVLPLPVLLPLFLGVAPADAEIVLGPLSQSLLPVPLPAPAGALVLSFLGVAIALVCTTSASPTSFLSYPQRTPFRCILVSSV